MYLIPLGLAALTLTYATDLWLLPVFMALTGLTLGCSATVQGALWAELFGVEHLGAIRALTTAAVVFASALSPGLVGILLDACVALEQQFLIMGLYCFTAALWVILLTPRLDRIATT